MSNIENEMFDDAIIDNLSPEEYDAFIGSDLEISGFYEEGINPQKVANLIRKQLNDN